MTEAIAMIEGGNHFEAEEGSTVAAAGITIMITAWLVVTMLTIKDMPPTTWAAMAMTTRPQILKDTIKITHMQTQRLRISRQLR